MSLAPNSPEAPGLRRGWDWCLVFAVIILGVALRLLCYETTPGIADEDITIEVVGHMRRSGDWDTSWVKADLTPDLKYEQYNFSTHLYATYFFYRLTKWLPGTEAWRSRDNGNAVYRFLAAALAAWSVLLTYQLARRVGDNITAIGATLLVGISTLLVQDAHYIRPEALTTVLTLVAVMWSLPNGAASRWRPIAAGFCIGLLIACKVSMVLLGWLPFVPVVAGWRSLRREGIVLLLVLVGIAIGFLGGAPGAVLHPSAFLNGVHHLMEQYAGLHPPHSHLHGGPVYDMLARYFVATLGWPIVVCASIGLYRCIREKRWAELVVLSGPWLLFFGYFSTRSTFFERNVSHVLPLLLIVAAQGAVAAVRCLPALRIRLGVVSLMVFAILVIQPARLTAALIKNEYFGRGEAAFIQYEARLRAQYPNAEWRYETLMVDEQLNRLADGLRTIRTPVLVRVTDYGDDWTAAMVKALFERCDVETVGYVPGSFPTVPTSTLLTYYSGHARYFLIRGLKAH